MLVAATAELMNGGKWRANARLTFCLINCIVSCVFCFALVALGVYGILALSPDEQYDSEHCAGVLIFQALTAYNSTSLVAAFLHFFLLLSSSFDVYLKGRRSKLFARFTRVSWGATLLLAAVLALVHALRCATLSVSTVFLELRGACATSRQFLFHAAHPLLLVNWFCVASMACFVLATAVATHVITNFCLPPEQYDTLELPESQQM